MPTKYNVEEIFEIACQIEQNGARFYRAAARIVTEPEARALLESLAAYEDQHEETFARLKAEASAKPDDFWTDMDDLAGSYVRAMASGLVFDADEDPAHPGGLQGNERFADILALALKAENDSIAYYTGVKGIMPPAWGPERIDAIIREEMSHVVFITEELAKLRG
jgi:rubrerythrin